MRMKKTREGKTSKKTLAVLCWAALWLVLLLLIEYPIKDRVLRFMTIADILLIWILPLCHWGNLKVVRYAFWGVLALAAFYFLGPARAFDTATLRREYVNALKSFTGTRYIWGGENHRGIDCSGLVRAGLIQTNLKVGLRSGNPALIRESLWLWWHDAPAKSLAEGYDGRSSLILKADSINELDPSRVLPGDFAVTSKGVHALAYLGNKVWIEADPGPYDKVIMVKVPSKKIAWVDIPVRIMRWKQFEPALP